MEISEALIGLKNSEALVRLRTVRVNLIRTCKEIEEQEKELFMKCVEAKKAEDKNPNRVVVLANECALVRENLNKIKKLLTNLDKIISSLEKAQKSNR
ncbi:hypothetical protein KKA72_00185 [Patescibacteria group bacterium]|nr:hypothetical protein [Patescibacteria group bacterium]MBU1876757.1 hypothetical protein [Patescibacteria group bacterium]